MLFRSTTSADIRTTLNIVSSALSKLLKFVDAELEQLICTHDNDLDAERFIERPTAIFLIAPDENETRHFLASLFVRFLTDDLIRTGYLNVAFCVLMGILVLFGFCFVIEPDYSNSEYSKQQFEGTYGEEDFTHGEIQEDGSVECYLDNGESISFPSEELVNTIFPNLEIKKES